MKKRCPSYRNGARVTFVGPHKITRDPPHDEAIMFIFLRASYPKLEIQYHTSEIIVYF